MPTIIAKPRYVRLGPLRLDRDARRGTGVTGHRHRLHVADSQQTNTRLTVPRRVLRGLDVGKHGIQVLSKPLKPAALRALMAQWRVQRVAAE